MCADPVVSPADTPEAAIRAALGVIARETAYSHEAVNRYALVEAVSDAAVALDALLAVGERDRQRADDWAKTALRRAEKIHELKAEGERVRERDRQHIAQLTEALEMLLGFARPVDIEACLVQAGVDVRAVLADKEDAS